MTFYPYALLLHIVGVLGMFMAIALEQAVLSRVRSAQSIAVIREWMRIMNFVDKLFPISGVIILVAGLYMVFTTWGWGHAWVDISLAVFLLTSAMAPTVTSPRFKAIHKASEAAPEGPLSSRLLQLTHNSVLLTAAFIMDFLTVGIVCLMTLKPGWIVSLAIIAAAFVVALVAARLIAARSSAVTSRQMEPELVSSTK